NRTDGRLLKIRKMQGWTSPLLKIRFELTDEELLICRPDGQKFLTFIETEAGMNEARKRAEEEKQRADKEKQRADKEKLRAEMLAAKLRELGVSVEDLE
ncbi:MAG: hypothetical protein V2I97_21230, partial [Desulfococcaceae bacterium]|nr:hypothetical protein [Desulfococcaceae bacterium]